MQRQPPASEGAISAPLTRKRMETIDEETLAAAKEFIQRQNKAKQPFFCWWNATRMHFRTHVKEDHTGLAGKSGDEYHDGMAVASKFLVTLKEYPPSQTPGDWSLSTLERRIKTMTAAGE
jgi:arylsulfatase A-like enzyme